MHFSVFYEHPGLDEQKSGRVTVGWLLQSLSAGVVFDAPERVRSVEMDKSHAKSASRCPAVLSFESWFFVIKCPFDLHLKFVRGPDGRPGLQNAAGKASSVRSDVLFEHVMLVPENEWRYPDRPTIQLLLPYVFLADEIVYLSQVSPFMHYRAENLPGTIFGGRFPINIWPRALTWAFEWCEPEIELVLKRGEPLFYVNFETEPQNRAVQLVEAERTEETLDYIQQVRDVSSYMKQTFSLFDTAEERRPAQLVVPKKRKG